MAKLYVHTVTVVGSVPFPIDMLRYDRCTPKTESDSNRIRQSMDDPMVGMLSVDVVRTDTANWHPTEARWESQGWKVTFIEKARLP